MMRWLVRGGLLVALPFILVWAFTATLIRETKRALWYAWQEVRIEMSSFYQCWERAPDA